MKYEPGADYGAILQLYLCQAGGRYKRAVDAALNWLLLWCPPFERKPHQQKKDQCATESLMDGPFTAIQRSLFYFAVSIPANNVLMDSLLYYPNCNRC